MNTAGLTLAQGRLGAVDAAFIRWLMRQWREEADLAVHVTQSMFEPVLPKSQLELFLSALESVQVIIRESEELSPFPQEKPPYPQIRTTVIWPEAELLDYSVARICKRQPLTEGPLQAAKLTTLQALRQQFGPRPPRRETVGLVSGSFDVIHPAHVHLMLAAKHAVDRLIVLTMTSASIRQQGKNCLGDRPIYSASDRVEVLAALRPVSNVVVFDDLNCLPSLEDFCPDYFFKSTADGSRPVVLAEAELVKQLGGKTVYLGGLPGGRSSTTIIDYIRKQSE
jgi:cytidyltransferase-like protein